MRHDTYQHITFNFRHHWHHHVFFWVPTGSVGTHEPYFNGFLTLSAINTNLKAGTYLTTFHSGVREANWIRKLAYCIDKCRGCTSRPGLGKKCVWRWATAPPFPPLPRFCLSPPDRNMLVDPYTRSQTWDERQPCHKLNLQNLVPRVKYVRFTRAKCNLVSYHATISCKALK